MERISDVIGEGGFGCVFKPSLPCAEKTLSYKGKLSKWMLSKEAMSEMEEYTVIAKADKNGDFYTGKPTRCTLKQTPATMKSIQKCKLYKEKFEKKTANELSTETALLIIGDGGMDLEKLMRKPNRFNKKEITLFWRECRRLFLGVKTFLKNDLLHHDLKPQNIVYKMESRRINFIDFGLMRSTKTEAIKCSVKNACRSKSHWNYPTDVLFMNKKTYETIGRKSIVERTAIFNEYMKQLKKKENTPFVNAFTSMYTYVIKREDTPLRNWFYEMYWKGFDDLLMVIKPENYEEFLKKSLSSFDVFGLGLSLMYILSRFKKMMDAKVVNEMYNLCFNMMTPNVFTRYSIERALLEYDRVLSKMS